MATEALSCTAWGTGRGSGAITSEFDCRQYAWRQPGSGRPSCINGEARQGEEGHDELIAAVFRAQADALTIEAQAKRRLADEYDAAQERGDVARQGGRRGNQSAKMDVLTPASTPPSARCASRCRCWLAVDCDFVRLCALSKDRRRLMDARPALSTP
jgi:hypothetical protein